MTDADLLTRPQDVKEIQAGPKGRHKTVQVTVGNVQVGGGAPIVVQSMTNTDTADIESTVTQVAALARARAAMVQSALLSAKRAEEIGLPKNKMSLSAKVSNVQDLIAVYRELASRSDYAIHLGLSEAGMGSKGIVASSAALGILLQDV